MHWRLPCCNYRYVGDELGTPTAAAVRMLPAQCAAARSGSFHLIHRAPRPFYSAHTAWPGDTSDASWGRQGRKQPLWSQSGMDALRDSSKGFGSNPLRKGSGRGRSSSGTGGALRACTHARARMRANEHVQRCADSAAARVCADSFSYNSYNSAEDPDYDLPPLTDT